MEAQPVLQPGQPAARTTRRPGRRSGSRPAGGSPTSSPASAPAARSRASAGTSRRPRTAGCGSSAPTRRARSTRVAPAGRTWSKGVGEDFWPQTYDRDDLRRDHRGLRQGLVRDHPPAGPRGRAARRRLLRHGGGGRARGRPPRRPGRRRGGAAARRRPRLPVQDLQRRVDGAVRLPALRLSRVHCGRRAGRQGRADAGDGARAPDRDGSRRHRLHARVRRLAAARAQGRAAGRHRRGGRLDRGARPARRAVHRPGPPARHGRAAHGRRRCR